MLHDAVAALEGIAVIVTLIASFAALYSSNRVMQIKLWVTTEVTKIVRDNCAGKDPFEAHIKADEVLLKQLAADAHRTETSCERQHADHYKHAAKQDIHQVSMSEKLLLEKFGNLGGQIEYAIKQVDKLTAAIEKR